MTKKMLATICMMLVATVGLFGNSVKAASSATWESKYVYGASYFDEEWEKTVTYKTESGTKIGIMIYGFDTDWIDEDYVWTKATVAGDSSLAEIQRMTVDEDILWGKKASSGTYSKIEVDHKNYYIKYQVKFYFNYGELSSSEKSSSVKD